MTSRISARVIGIETGNQTVAQAAAEAEEALNEFLRGRSLKREDLIHFSVTPVKANVGSWNEGGDSGDVEPAQRGVLLTILCPPERI